MTIDLDSLVDAGRRLRAAGLHASIVADVPQLKRGRVWCHECGATMAVDSAACLRGGWPKCCGYTMSIDSPEERAKHAGGAK